MKYYFSVHAGLEDRTVIFELSSDTVCIYQVSVMSYCYTFTSVPYSERLGICY